MVADTFPLPRTLQNLQMFGIFIEDIYSLIYSLTWNYVNQFIKAHKSLILTRYNRSHAPLLSV